MCGRCNDGIWSTCALHILSHCPFCGAVVFTGFLAGPDRYKMLSTKSNTNAAADSELDTNGLINKN